MSFSRTTARTGKLAAASKPASTPATAAKKSPPPAAPATGGRTRQAAVASSNTKAAASSSSSLRGAIFDRLRAIDDGRGDDDEDEDDHQQRRRKLNEEKDDQEEDPLDDSLDDSAWEQEVQSRQAFLHGLSSGATSSGKQDSQANAAVADHALRPVPPATQPQAEQQQRRPPHRELGGLDEDDDAEQQAIDSPSPHAGFGGAFSSVDSSSSVHPQRVRVPSLFDLAVEQLGLQYHAICEQDIAARLPPGTLTQAIAAVRKAGKLTDHHLPLLFRTLTKSAAVSSRTWLEVDCGLDALVASKMDEGEEEGRAENQRREGEMAAPQTSPASSPSPSPPTIASGKTSSASRARPSPTPSPPPAAAAPIRFAPLRGTPGVGTAHLGHSLNTATLARMNKAVKLAAQTAAGMIQPHLAAAKALKGDRAVKAIVKTNNVSASSLPPRAIVPKEFHLVTGEELDLHAQYKLTDHGWRLLAGFMEFTRKGAEGDDAQMAPTTDESAGGGGASLSRDEMAHAEANFTDEQRRRLASIGGVSDDIRALVRKSSLHTHDSSSSSSSSLSRPSSSLPPLVVSLVHRFGLWRPVHLIHLDVSFSGITSDGLALLAKECPALVKVNICGCQQLKNRAITALVRWCPQIQVLLMEVLPCLDDTAVQDVIHGLKSLLALDIGSCRRMTNVGWQVVGSHGRTLKRLSAAGCLQTTDFDVEDLCKCVSLLSLSLRACAKLTDASVDHLVSLSHRKKKARMRGLQSLDLGGCARLTDGSINALVGAYAASLTHLDLRGLTRITDRCLDAIQAHCHRPGRPTQVLQELTLAACTGIRPERIDQLRLAWPDLRVLV